MTLCASDLASGSKGAALSVGVNERDYGIESAKKARLLLNNPHAIVPVTRAANYKVALNTSTMVAQNLKPDPRFTLMITNGHSF